MYHARVLAASHSIYGRVVTEGALLYTDCPKNSLSPLLQGQPVRPSVPSRDSQGQLLPGARLPGQRGFGPSCAGQRMAQIAVHRPAPVAAAKLRHWDTWRWATTPWPWGIICSGTTSPLSPTLWSLSSSSVLPSESGPDSRCDVWARAWGYAGERLARTGPAVPISMGLRCTPTPRCERIDGPKWNACCGTW